MAKRYDAEPFQAADFTVVRLYYTDGSVTKSFLVSCSKSANKLITIPGVTVPSDAKPSDAK